MPTLSQRLLFASRQCYAIAGNGPVPDAANSSDIGWSTGPTGFVAGTDDIDAGMVGETPGEIIIAFRGTFPPGSPGHLQTLQDWLNDFDALLVNDPCGFAGKVHQGFAGSRDLLWGAVKTALAPLVAANLAKPVWVTGHSKGGTVANLAAARLKQEQLANPLGVCTFAAARPGDPNFAAAYSTAVPQSDRYEYQDDVVPHVPMSDPFAALAKAVPEVMDLIGHFNDGFASVGTLHFIDWNNAILIGDLPLLHLRRFAHLAERLGAGQLGVIAADHSIDPGSGYAGAPC